MPRLRETIERQLEDGKIDGREMRALGELLLKDGALTEREADALVELHRRSERSGPAFERFFYRSIKQYLLQEERIGAWKTEWLRGVLFADGRITSQEKKLVRELKGEAAETCPEFEELVSACLCP